MTCMKGPKSRLKVNTVEPLPYAAEMWPSKRGGLLSGVEINTYMFTFTLSSGLSRGVSHSSGWPLKRGSTIFVLIYKKKNFSLD